MTDVTRGAEMDMQLASAVQTIMLLRSQAQTGKVDASFLERRLGSVENVMNKLIEQRKANQQQERLAKLYEVSRVIGSSLDLQTVLDQVMDAVIALTGAERGFLMLLDDDGKLTVKVARNFDQATIDSSAFALSRTVTNNVLATGKAIVTTNAQEDPRFANQQSVVANSLRSIMASPLRVRGQVIGVTYVDNRVRTGMFSDKDLDVLDTFAGQAAVAIDNARLFSATDQALAARVEELTMLQWIDRQLNETLDPAKAMLLTLEWISRVCNAESATMWLLAEENTLLNLVSHYGPDDAYTNEMSMDVNQPFVRQLIESHEPTLVQLQDGKVSFLLPVHRESHLIGLMAIVSATAERFADETKSLVIRVADRAAIAIENAQLYNAVRAANNAKSEFVSLVAHELKVPMTGIQGYADLLLMIGSLSDKQQNFVAMIKNSVNKMKVLVSDLSDISRIESGNMRVDLTDVNVNDVINSATEGTLTEIERREHKLVMEIDPELPPVRADQGRLTQVLLNLVSNAYKYSPNGATITVRASRQDSQVLISVQDTGVGMTPEQLAKLGTKFWRGDNGLEQQGTGLGFAITRNLIELMHGTLAIESTPGMGSTFTVGLPVAAGRAE